MKRFAPLVALGLALSGCASSPDPVDPPAALKPFKPGFEVRRTWEAQLGSGTAGGYLRLGPELEGDMLYAATRHGLVRAYSATNGSRIWSKALNLPISSGPTISDDLLLLGADDEVIALDRATAEVRWRASLTSEIVVEPVRHGDVIVARTVDGALYGFNAKDGTRLWRSQEQQAPLLSLRGQSAPVPVGDVVIVGFDNGRVAAMALEDGRLVWETPIAEPRGRTELERVTDVDGRIVIGDGVVFAAGFHGRIAALALATGQVLWVRDISSHQGIAAAEGELFVTDYEGNVWALSQNSGATLWRQSDLHGRGLGAPVVQGKTVIVGDYDGYLHWLSREDGRFMARMQVKNFGESFPVPPSESDLPPVTDDRNLLAPPLVTADQVFAVDKRGAVTAFRVQTGANR